MVYNTIYGANPSFRITLRYNVRSSNNEKWDINFILYGTNDISNVGGNDGGSDAYSLNITGLTQIFNVSNPIIGIEMLSNWRLL